MSVGSETTRHSSPVATLEQKDEDSAGAVGLRHDDSSVAQSYSAYYATIFQSSGEVPRAGRCDKDGKTSVPSRASSSSPVKKGRNPLPADWAPLHRKQRCRVSYADIGQLSAAVGGLGVSVSSEGIGRQHVVSSSVDASGSGAEGKRSPSLGAEPSGGHVKHRDTRDLHPSQAACLNRLFEEMDLRCCWLARYWAMCEKYKLYPGVSEEQSRYWSDRVATITEEGGQLRDIHEAARRYLTQGARPYSVAHMSSDTAGDDGAHQLDADFLLRLARALAGMTEVERAVRLVQELRVPDYVLLSITDGAQIVNLAHLMSHPTDKTSYAVSAAEIEEISFRRSWVAYLWASASALGVEKHLSGERAEYWGSRLGLEPTHQELVDLDSAVSELQEHAIEHKAWQARVQQCLPHRN